jgi:hypothetical protein
MTSELLKTTADLLKQYYLFKQEIIDYEKSINIHCEIIKSWLLTFPEKEKEWNKTIKECETNLLIMKEELNIIKHKLSLLPHIPNKKERKIIRQNKAKLK